MDLFSATQYLLFLAIVTALVTSLGRHMANGSRRVPDLMSLPHSRPLSLLGGSVPTELLAVLPHSPNKG